MCLLRLGWVSFRFSFVRCQVHLKENCHRLCAAPSSPVKRSGKNTTLMAFERGWKLSCRQHLSSGPVQDSFMYSYRAITSLSTSCSTGCPLTSLDVANGTSRPTKHQFICVGRDDGSWINVSFVTQSRLDKPRKWSSGMEGGPWSAVFQQLFLRCCWALYHAWKQFPVRILSAGVVNADAGRGRAGSLFTSCGLLKKELWEAARQVFNLFIRFHLLFLVLGLSRVFTFHWIPHLECLLVCRVALLMLNYNSSCAKIQCSLTFWMERCEWKLLFCISKCPVSEN